MEYRRVEGIRRCIRAVCRSWKAFVDNCCIDLTISDFQRTTVPSESHLSHAARIEFPADWRCICKQCPYKFPRDTSKASQYHWRLTGLFSLDCPQFDSPFKPGCARVVLLNTAQRDMVDYLYHAPLLTAFEGKLSLLWGNKEAQVHSIFERLTHLSILRISTMEMIIPLVLPRLRFLQLALDLEERDPPTENHAPLESWVLSSLTSLVIEGPVGGIYYDDLLQFLQNHSSTIENFVMQYYEFVGGVSQPHHIDIRHLRQYPRLRVLGLSVVALDEDWGKFDLKDNESTLLRLSLLLTDINELFRRSHDRIPGSARQCLRVCTSPGSIFEKVVMVHSWNQLIQQWDAEEQDNRKRNTFGADPFLYAWLFFKELYETDITFLDRDGVELRQGDGLKFLERLKKHNLGTALVYPHVDFQCI
ncbi:hypothetical protein FRC19_006454 [Serendipita sp. 401]|nr:hypothetical protein FRC19_006454 [Serendipita sp. 401]